MALPRSLNDQAYIPVDMQTLAAQKVIFPGGTGAGNLDKTLISASSGPVWSQICGLLHQLTLPPFHATGIYLRRDTKDLEVCVTQSWRGKVTVEAVKKELDHAWTIVSSLARQVDAFQLSDETVAAMEAVKPGGTAETMTSVAHVVLRLMLDVSKVETATGTLLVVAPEGLDPKLVQRLERIGGLYKQDNWSARPPSLAVVGIDAPKVAAHGHTMRGSLEVGKLGKSLRYYLGVAS